MYYYDEKNTKEKTSDLNKDKHLWYFFLLFTYRNNYMPKPNEELE